MELMVSDFGTFIGKKSERLVLKQNGRSIQEIPFFELEHITIDTKGASISADAIRECCEHGIPISFLGNSGQPYATLISPNLVGTVVTRREQLLAYKDQRGVKLVKAIIEGKLKNQANLLKYFAKYRKERDIKVFEEISQTVENIDKLLAELKSITAAEIDDVRQLILSVEGRAGNMYWEAVKVLLDEKVKFPGRQHRGTTDPVNCMLNYGYGILTKQVESCLIRAGLDVFGGFLHVDRSGKESLVYDFVEEFRQPVVDRVVFAMVNKGFAPQMEDGFLNLNTRRELAAKVFERLDSNIRFQGKKHRVKTIIQMQARRMALFLRGEGKYQPFISGW